MSRVWTKKPPVGTKINFAHPMVKDMFFFCALDRSGNQIDLINNTVGDRITGGDMGLLPTSKGITTDWNNFDTDTTVGFDFGNTVGGSGAYEPTNLTIIASVRTGSLSDTAGSRIVSKRQGVSASDDYCIYWGPDDQFRYRINGAEDIINPSALSSLVNRNFEVALAAASSGQDNYFWDLDGTGVDHDLGNSGATVDGSVGNLCVGHRESQDRSWNGIIHYVALWSVKKDQAFIEAFRANPWQIFELKPHFALATPQHELIKTSRNIWTKQPPAGTKIDWSNPLTIGLQICLPFSDGLLLSKNVGLLTELNLDSISGVPEPLVAQDRRGSYIDFPDDTSRIVASAAIDLLAISTSGSYITGYTFGAGTAAQKLFGYGNNFELVLKTNTNVEDADMWVGGNNVALPNGLSQNIYYQTARTVQDVGGSTGDVRIFHQEENGQPVFVDSYNAALLAQTADDFTIGNSRPIGHAEGLVGRLYFVYIWSRALLDTEILSLMINPWQIFKAPETMVLKDIVGPPIAILEPEVTSMPPRPPR